MCVYIKSFYSDYQFKDNNYVMSNWCYIHSVDVIGVSYVDFRTSLKCTFLLLQKPLHFTSSACTFCGGAFTPAVAL